MQLPALPEKLQYCEKAESSKTLFEMLVRHPPDLLLFLELACRDMAWVEANSDFMMKAVNWVHLQFFQDKLMMELVQPLAEVFRRHFDQIKKFLPLNATLKLKDKDIPINTFLYGSRSEYLRVLLRLEFRDRRAKSLFLKEVSFEMFHVIQDYIEKGEYQGIYVKDQKTVEKILEFAILWELEELATECQIHLKKWINRENAVETLLFSHKNGWLELRAGCMEYINFLNLDMRFQESTFDRLAFEFIRFTENSLEIFIKTKAFITDLICSGSTTEEEEFSRVVVQCPKLICLNLNYSNQWSDFLKAIPEDLEELILSSCEWLNNENFGILLERSPDLTKLVLASDLGLNFEAWGALQKLPQLNTLDLTRCSQIGDDELQLILQACEKLISLSIEECRGITDAGFYNIPKLNSRFVHLNFARSNITDQPLIELAGACQELNSLDLTRCEKITEKGVIELVRLARHLRFLNLRNCDVPESILAKIKSLYPYLKIISPN